MADLNRSKFDKRVKALERKRRPGKRIVRKMQNDGLVVEVAKTKKAALIPYKSLFFAAFIFIFVKGFLFAEIGPAAYETRIETMRNGNTGEIAAAFLLDADPVTRQVARLISYIVPT